MHASSCATAYFMTPSSSIHIYDVSHTRAVSVPAANGEKSQFVSLALLALVRRGMSAFVKIKVISAHAGRQVKVLCTIVAVLLFAILLKCNQSFFCMILKSHWTHILFLHPTGASQRHFGWCGW